MNQDLFAKKVLKRSQSLFTKDIEDNRDILSENIEGKSVLVIGGAGTIGSFFIKALMCFLPNKMIVIDISENELTELVRDLRSTERMNICPEFYTYPISFSSPVFLKIFQQHGPFDIVANFAAHKHVRSEKDIFSIEALLDNNLFKAKDLLDTLLVHPPKHFFCVSTDKAANPVNIMGASKKLMEDMILSYSDHIKISTARFANVAFSNGSLLYGFMMRLSKSQPLSCPKDVKRFFVTPQEAGEICMLACILGSNGEIFFPKMDAEASLMNFADILPLYLSEYGFKQLVCDSEEEAKANMYRVKENLYPVFFFNSNTDGEKLYEEFFTDKEILDTDHFQALGIIRKKPTHSIQDMNVIITEIKAVCTGSESSKQSIVSILKKHILEFDHIETGRSLDSKM